MENRAKTSALEQNHRSSGNNYASYHNTQNEKDWQEENINANGTPLHQFPTHPDVPQGNPHDGKKHHDQGEFSTHHEDVQEHAAAQREMLPRKEKPTSNGIYNNNGKRADGNGADFDDVPQSTSSRIERSRAMMGLRPEAPIVEEHDFGDHADLKWSMFRGALKEPLAEFFGTLILVCFGNGSVAQVQLSAGQASAPGGNGFGDYQSINWGWGLGVMLGIYVAGDSGAYLK